MKCQSCQADSPDGAKFCMQCGAALQGFCSACQIDLPAGARFCHQCGIAVGSPASTADAGQATAPAAPTPAPAEKYIPRELAEKLESARARGGMQGERRVVTMLFCDVQGSTAAAEQLDPEEWVQIMNGAFEHLIAPVFRYEGTLASLMGDAILAFFGAPIAHEDDPQRAVLAGLDIIDAIGPYREQVRRQWGLDFNVRVGINTGLVVVGEVGSDLRVEYTALGDAVNLAARMEQTADPGTIRITGGTQRLIAPLFDFEDLGLLEVKGKSEPVPTFQVLGQRAQPGRLRGIEGLESPLVGRRRELGALRDAVSELRQGRGQIVSVMGEAGLGKSRLIAELRSSVLDKVSASASGARARTNGASPSGLDWIEGRSQSYETERPYTPFIDLFSSCFGLRPDQTDAEKYAALKSAVAGASPERADEIAPFIATLLGIELPGDTTDRVRYLSPPQVRERVFTAVTELVEGMALARPFILLFEDVHWSDPTSLDLIEQLLPVTERAPLMLVSVFRPWRQEPSWRLHEVCTRDYSHRYRAVMLEPLGSDDSRALVANLLEVEDLPERVRALILAKAEGNPFFVEEVIRSLLDAGLVVREDSHWRATREIVDISVPDTLAGVITARIDRLGDDSKRVAQTASVIGREFQFDALASVHEEPETLDAALTDLQRRELIREKSRVPQRRYIYKHALTRETVYSSMLLRRRRELHGQIAEYLERVEPERAGELARHFLEAGARARALPYVVESADRAARAYSTREAIGLYTQARELIEPDTAAPLVRRVYEGLGGAVTFANDIPRAMKLYEEMRELAVSRADLPMQVSALNKLGFATAIFRGEIPRAESYLSDAEQIASSCDDLPGLAEFHMTHCFIRTTSGEFDGALSHLSESAQLGEQMGAGEPQVFGLTHIANTLVYMTRFDEAWPAIQKARNRAEEFGDQRYLAELLGLTAAFCHLRNGDLDAARRSSEEGLELASQIGAAQQESTSAYMLGQLAQAQGEYARALSYYEHAASAARTAFAPYIEAVSICSMGTINFEIGDEHAKKGVEMHGQALALMNQPLGTAFGAAAWAEIGYCALAIGDAERAASLFKKGLEISTGAKYLMKPMLLVGSAFIALGESRVPDAQQLVQEAREFADERAMRHFGPLIELAHGQVTSAQGDTGTARASFARAEKLAVDMNMRPLVWQARASIAQTLAAEGRPEEADAKRAEAKAMIGEIGGLFLDEALGVRYVESATARLG